MSLYAEVTAKIVAELEKGAAPWVKQWSGDGFISAPGSDINFVSKRRYRGINRILLSIVGRQFTAPHWATYQQWQGIGGQVRKGEKGTPIVFYKQLSISEERDGEKTEKSIPLLRQFTVFNIDQVDGVERVAAEPLPEVERLAHCERTIAATGAKITHGGDRACFIPSADRICLPHLVDFDTKQAYYATAFHELIHWSGVKERCDRDLSGRFGDSSYAFEELVAELGAAMLCADHNVQGDLRHAGYIGHWLKCLKENDRAIFRAAALAEKAAEFISQEREEERLAA